MLQIFLSRGVAAAAIVLSLVCGDTLSAAASRATATFGTASRYPLDAFGPPHALAVADVNGDGHLDLVAATCESNTACGSVTILLGNGDGTFRGPLSLGSGGNGASAIAVADVTGDGRPDLVVANFASDTVGVLAARGDGWFDTAMAYPTTAAGTGAVGPSGVAVADLDGDGLADLVVTHAQATRDGARAISVLYGQKGGGFGASVTYAGGGLAARAVAIADMNGDRLPNLVVSHDWAGFSDVVHATVSVLLGRRAGGFAPAVPVRLDGWGAASLAVADVNRDGHRDVVVALGSPKRAAVLLGRGDGTLRAAQAFDTGGIDLNVQTRAGSLALADVSGDGGPDLLAASCFGASCASSIAVLEGVGNGTFRPAVAVDGGGIGAGLVAAGDLDHDGTADAVIATCADAPCAAPALAVLLRSQDPAADDGARQASAAASSTMLATAALAGQPSDAAVYNVRVASSGSPDLTDLASFISSVTSRWSASSEKVWALFYWMQKLRVQNSPMVLHGFEVTDPIRNLTDFGYTMCSTVTGINQVLYEAIGLRHGTGTSATTRSRTSSTTGGSTWWTTPCRTS